MMSTVTIAAIFLVTLGVSLIWGVRWAYVAVFLPTLLMLNQIPEITLQHAPVMAHFAPMYAILIALPFRGESFRFRVNAVDVVILLLAISAAITGWATEVFETGFNALRNEVLRLAMPYFLARVVFQDWHMRRVTLRLLIGLMAVIGFCAAVEFRMIPYFYLHMLQSVGMGNDIHAMAYARYGFYRVSGTVEHPIFFGNMCVVILGMLAVLARTSGERLRNPWVAAAMVTSLACVIMSISYTPFLGLIAGGLGLAALLGMRWTRRMLLPLTIAMFAGMFAYTYHLATTPLPQSTEDDRNGIGGSINTRHLIVAQSWGKALTAGPFGYGLRHDFSDETDFDLASVDNSYMQFTMTRGWVYTALWISIGILFAWRAQRAFTLATDPSQTVPLAVATATVLGLMVSMYTVWAGALYTVLWMIMLGLSNTLIDQVYAAAAARAAVPAPVGPLRPPTVRMPAAAAAAAGRLGTAH